MLPVFPFSLESKKVFDSLLHEALILAVLNCLSIIEERSFMESDSFSNMLYSEIHILRNRLYINYLGP